MTPSIRSRAQDLVTGTELDIRTRAVVDATGVWEAEAGPPVRRRLSAHPAEPWRSPGRAAGTHPEQARSDDPRARQGRLPRAMAGPLADRHDRCAVRGAVGSPGRGRLGDRPPARYRQRDDGRGPAPRGCRRYVRRAATADLDHRRIDREGVSRAPRVGRGERRGRGSAVASTRPTGSWRATSSTPCSARPRPRRASERDGRAATRRGGRHRRTRADRRRARDDPGPRGARSRCRGTARRPARDGGAERRGPRRGAGPHPAVGAGPAVPRGRGDLGGPPRAGDVARRHARAPDSAGQELPDRGAAIAPRVAELLGTELGWGETRRAREVETYLETAWREYAVAGPAQPEGTEQVA